MAVQYAKAMGLNVVAVDISESKLDLAKKLGAALAVNARDTDPIAFVKKEVGGAQGVLVTAVSPKAFEQALGMVGRGGTVSLVGLPPGSISRSHLRHRAESASPFAARSWARAWTCRRRSISRATAR